MKEIVCGLLSSCSVAPPDITAESRPVSMWTAAEDSAKDSFSRLPGLLVWWRIVVPSARRIEHRNPMFETMRQRPQASVWTGRVRAMQGLSQRHVSYTGKHLNENQMITWCDG